MILKSIITLILCLIVFIVMAFIINDNEFINWGDRVMDNIDNCLLRIESYIYEIKERIKLEKFYENINELCESFLLVKVDEIIEQVKKIRIMDESQNRQDIIDAGFNIE